MNCFVGYMLSLSMVVVLLNAQSMQGIGQHVTAPEKKRLQKAIFEHVTIYPRAYEGSETRLKRRAILTRYEGAVATIVLCHGFLCDKYDIACFRNMFPIGKFNFLTFDFRGHGEDVEGQVSTLGHDEALDVIAAVEFIRAHPVLKDLPLFTWAFSMGAVAVLEAQGKDNTLFDAIIVDCAYDSSEKLIQQAFNQMRFSLFGYTFDIPGRAFLERYALHPYVQSFIQKALKVCLHWDTKHVHLQAVATHPIQSIANIQVPCFFIHCAHDEKVPLASVQELYNAAGGYKRFWITEGRRHFDSFFYKPEVYAYRVCKFFDQVLDQSLFGKSKSKVIKDSDLFGV